MDPRSTEQERKRQLIARLDASRAQLQVDRQLLRDKLHPIRRIQGAVKSKPLRAFGLAAGTAFAMSFLVRRTKSSKPLTLKRLLWRWGFSLARPAIRLWLLDQVKKHLLSAVTEKLKPYHTDSP